ncbi:helix-turn-helix domain-containing protein [Arthrobacter burdickii]|uniref:Helix-turn-helix transcriptional regulator n=1 Tax=Arthrobacter burdickii TaxID=3035920 RepID=A0ABT8K0K4_9MICC|nr:helix-turn-helix transcriptional regulator [Arthrobacter burdickii]MDN4609914.1 helix-turn-helix transcriptional regulator [Arthrobacter burdickii]
MSKAVVSKIETASTSCSLTTLRRLADGLGIPVTVLFAAPTRTGTLHSRSMGRAV